MVDRVTLTTPNPTAPEGHDEAMIALAEGTEAPAKEDGEKLLAGKYKSVEDLEAAYGELAKKLGKPKEEAEPESEKAPEVEPESEKAPEVDPADEVAAEKAVEAAGLNFQDLESEFAKEGALTDASYEALEKGGIPREYVDAFIEGRVALAEKQTAEVMAVAGGEDGYNALCEWAASNLTDDEVDVFNSTIDAGDTRAIRLAVKGLKAQMDAAVDVEPTKRVDNGRPSQDAGGFQSVAQMTAAIRDPRYATDEAYRKEVARKIEAAGF